MKWWQMSGTDVIQFELLVIEEGDNRTKELQRARLYEE